MSNEAIVYVEVNPVPEFPSNVGAGPQLPVVIDLTTAGRVTFEELGIPVSTDITVELWGGGGGGAGSPVGSSPGGGGGGAGAYLLVTMTTPSDLADWHLTVGAAGTGGAAATNGVDGGASLIENQIDDPIATAGPGLHGIATLSVGGAGGTGSVDTGATLVRTVAGLAGSHSATAAGGAGGSCKGPGGGAGGAGGTGTSGAGAAGGGYGAGGGGGSATVGIGGAGFKGRVRVTFNVGE